jgi:hypothetical protein
VRIMEYKYPKQLIERSKELYGKHSPSELSDSDVVECIDNMSSLLNCLGGLYEKHNVKSDADSNNKNESID